MKKLRIILAVSLLLVTASAFADRKFNAADVPSAKIKKSGRIVISNDDKSISAYQFFGNIRESLVSLKSSRIPFNPFGSTLFNPNARAAAPAHLADAIAEASRRHGVDPRLVTAIARRESAFNANAVSRVGACGIMQLMPATARYLGVTNVFDPRENINGGTRYLRTLLDTFNGDLDLALAAYNAGPGAVARYKGVPPYRETREYVRIVRASYEQALRQ